MLKTTPIAIIGGGQLGQMLLQAGSPWGLHFKVLDNSLDAPCATLTPYFERGQITDFEAVYQFAKQADIITIEIEHVNTQALSALAKEGKKVFPQPHIISMIQDKILQKKFYFENQIPTPEAYFIERASELQQYENKLPLVQKLARDGYDGRGVQILNTPDDFMLAFDKPSILEEKIDIQKELAVIIVRNEAGETSIFPIVEMVFNTNYNLVDYIFSPARISKNTANKMIEIANKIVNNLNIVGILAIEMFLDQEDNVWVNEMAPRPHNSGHHTIEGCYTSQFEQHLRAILGLPFGSTALRQGFAGMLNLIGEAGYIGTPHYQNIYQALAMEGVFVHLYNKTQTRPSRKMGHISVVAPTFEALTEKINTLKEMIKVVSL